MDRFLRPLLLSSLSWTPRRPADVFGAGGDFLNYGDLWSLELGPKINPIVLVFFYLFEAAQVFFRVGHGMLFIGAIAGADRRTSRRGV